MNVVCPVMVLSSSYPDLTFAFVVYAPVCWTPVQARGKGYAMKVILQGFSDWAKLRMGLTEAGKYKLD